MSTAEPDPSGRALPLRLANSTASVELGELVELGRAGAGLLRAGLNSW
ncbi:hypothetical protein [Cryobacterium sp. TMT2-15-1]|nr:hypothetical protein [Cryobacterium sp. TMT2-15-1]